MYIRETNVGYKIELKRITNLSDDFYPFSSHKYITTETEYVTGLFPFFKWHFNMSACRNLIAQAPKNVQNKINQQP